MTHQSSSKEPGPRPQALRAPRRAAGADSGRLRHRLSESPAGPGLPASTQVPAPPSRRSCTLPHRETALRPAHPGSDCRNARGPPGRWRASCYWPATAANEMAALSKGEARLVVSGAGRPVAAGGLVQPGDRASGPAERPEASGKPRGPTRRGVDLGCGRQGVRSSPLLAPAGLSRYLPVTLTTTPGAGRGGANRLPEETVSPPVLFRLCSSFPSTPPLCAPRERSVSPALREQS